MTSKIYQNKDPLKHDTCDTYNKNVIWVPQNQITNIEFIYIIKFYYGGNSKKQNLLRLKQD